jgi:HEPN domain-containing protein
MATAIDLARQLLRVASDDEFAARSVLSIEGVTDAILGFHAQQAVEKAIKAVLVAKGIKFRFSHNLDYLRDLCSEAGIELPEALDGMENLTPFATAERYGSPAPAGLDREQALAWAAGALAWARTTI